MWKVAAFTLELVDFRYFFVSYFRHLKEKVTFSTFKCVLFPQNLQSLTPNCGALSAQKLGL